MLSFKVSKLVHAIKMGWLKPKPPRLDKDPFSYDMWEDADSVSAFLYFIYTK